MNGEETKDNDAAATEKSGGGFVMKLGGAGAGALILGAGIGLYNDVQAMKATHYPAIQAALDRAVLLDRVTAEMDKMRREINEKLDRIERRQQR